MRRCESAASAPSSAPESARRGASDADRELNALRCAGRGRNSEPPRLSAARRADMCHRLRRVTLSRQSPVWTCTLRSAATSSPPLCAAPSGLDYTLRVDSGVWRLPHNICSARVQRAGAVARVGASPGDRAGLTRRERAEMTRRRRRRSAIARRTRPTSTSRHPRLGRARRHRARAAGRAKVY